jgi:molybdenum cofactor synthesis domain-containing protein
MHNYHPTAAIIVIGNEILSGRTQDTNIQFLGKHLSDLGIDLVEARIVTDNESAIIEAVNHLRALHTYVFTTGGIGGTHDDITFASIAKAFNQPLIENQEVIELIRAYYGDDRLTPARRKMALMSKNVKLLKNSTSKDRAFQFENVFVLAGIPSVMHSMFDILSPHLKPGNRFHCKTITCSLQEGVIAETLTQIQNRYPTLNVGSYPFFKDEGVGVSFVVRGQDLGKVNKAASEICSMIQNFGEEPIIEK